MFLKNKKKKEKSKHALQDANRVYKHRVNGEHRGDVRDVIHPNPCVAGTMDVQTTAVVEVLAHHHLPRVGGIRAANTRVPWHNHVERDEGVLDVERDESRRVDLDARLFKSFAHCGLLGRFVLVDAAARAAKSTTHVITHVATVAEQVMIAGARIHTGDVDARNGRVVWNGDGRYRERLRGSECRAMAGAVITAVHATSTAKMLLAVLAGRATPHSAHAPGLAAACSVLASHR